MGIVYISVWLINQQWIQLHCTRWIDHKCRMSYSTYVRWSVYQNDNRMQSSVKHIQFTLEYKHFPTKLDCIISELGCLTVIFMYSNIIHDPTHVNWDVLVLSEGTSYYMHKFCMFQTKGQIIMDQFSVEREQRENESKKIRKKVSLSISSSRTNEWVHLHKPIWPFKKIAYYGKKAWSM